MRLVALGGQECAAEIEKSLLRAIARTDARYKCDQRSRILDGEYYPLERLIQQERYVTLAGGRGSSSRQGTLCSRTNPIGAAV